MLAAIFFVVLHLLQIKAVQFINCQIVLYKTIVVVKFKNFTNFFEWFLVLALFFNKKRIKFPINSEKLYSIDLFETRIQVIVYSLKLNELTVALDRLFYRYFADQCEPSIQPHYNNREEYPM